MGTFFRDGGWGMYPTTLFGFLLVAAGVLCLLRPERRFVPLVLCLGALTLSSGLLGTTTGLVNTFHYLPRVQEVDQRFTIAALGCAESLNNLVLALILLTLTGVLGAVAALRAALSSRAEPAAA
jgi:dipeptide/tripeptide permease